MHPVHDAAAPNRLKQHGPHVANPIATRTGGAVRHGVPDLHLPQQFGSVVAL